MFVTMRIQENISLKSYNTFGLDVSCRYFAEVTTIEELKDVLQNELCKKHQLFILGGGSNLLLTKDVDALVVKISIGGVNILEENENDVLIAGGAGEVWHEFVMKSLELRCYGLENLSLIPGCVGASPMQNIGAYGVEIKDKFEYLEALNIETLELEVFDTKACEFGYRESVFKRKLKGKYIITRVVFRLSRNSSLNTSYGAIEAELTAQGISNPTPKDVSNAVIAIRESKLPNPKEIGNSGSFFKNPVVSVTTLNKIKENYPDVVNYKVDDNNFKLAAGWLIEQAGWKGKTFDTYGVHKKQALVLVNYGGSKGSDIYNLSQQIIDSVNSKYGVLLEREVNIY
jgi:UDP-N-acetylmuramate dehydrogenase